MPRVTPIWMLLVPATLLAAEVPSVQGPGDPVPAGRRVEFRVEMARTYSDPFDPAVVAVDAEVTGPGGEVFRVAGFWAQDFTSRLDGATEVLEAAGEPSFRVRFRPVLPGTYSIVVTVRDADGEAVSPAVTFEVGPLASDFAGYVRRDPADPSALVRTTGGRYVPFGFNVCWSGAGGTTEFERWFQHLADNGLDWTRVWMTHFNGTALEWKAGEDGGTYCGLGCYNLKAGWRLDRILDLAESRGIAVQVVLQQHSQFETGKWSSWDQNPWNANNGGPLEHSADFFTRPDVIALFDRKIRYIVARWADSPAVLAWELFNELELIDGIKMDAAHAWSRERADLIRAMDPYGHLVTTSYAMPGVEGVNQDWGFEGYAITQAHTYFPFYWETIDATAAWLRAFGKPAILAEFGVDYLGWQNFQDTKGVHLLNATLLAGLVGFSGGAMSWWWDGYVEVLDLWPVVGRAAASLRKAGIENWTGILEGAKVVGDDSLVIRAATTRTGAIAWLHDKGSEWDAGDAYIERTHSRVRVSVPVRCDGGTVTFLGPWTGQVEGTGLVEAGADGFAEFEAPEFVRDLLVRLDCPPPPPEPEPEPEPVPEPLRLADESGPPDLPVVPGSPEETVDVPAPRSHRGGCSAGVF